MASPTEPNEGVQGAVVRIVLGHSIKSINGSTGHLRSLVC